MRRSNFFNLILKQFLCFLVSLIQCWYHELSIGFILIQDGYISTSSIFITRFRFFDLFLFLDICLYNPFLKFLVLNFEQIDLTEVSIQLIEVLHMIEQASDCYFVIIGAAPHRFVSTFNFFETSKLGFDRDFENLFRLEWVNIPVKSLHF